MKMTKKEAVQALYDGKALTHTRFSPGEYIHMWNGKLKDEDGYILHGFWTIRTGRIWENGWSIFNKQ